MQEAADLISDSLAYLNEAKTLVRNTGVDFVTACRRVCPAGALQLRSEAELQLIDDRMSRGQSAREALLDVCGYMQAEEVPDPRRAYLESFQLGDRAFTVAEVQARLEKAAERGARRWLQENNEMATRYREGDARVKRQWQEHQARRTEYINEEQDRERRRIDEADHRYQMAQLDAGLDKGLAEIKRRERKGIRPDTTAYRVERLKELARGRKMPGPFDNIGRQHG
jgi:hypothetical protein